MNTLAYYNTEFITAVKSFIPTAPGARELVGWRGNLINQFSRIYVGLGLILSNFFIRSLQVGHLS